MAYEVSTTASVETTNTTQVTTSTYDKNSSLGVQNAINLRRRLGKLTEFFDQRLLGDEYTPRFQFNAQEYDLIYGELISNTFSSDAVESDGKPLKAGVAGGRGGDTQGNEGDA